MAKVIGGMQPMSSRGRQRHWPYFFEVTQAKQGQHQKAKQPKQNSKSQQHKRQRLKNISFISLILMCVTAREFGSVSFFTDTEEHLLCHILWGADTYTQACPDSSHISLIPTRQTLGKSSQAGAAWSPAWKTWWRNQDVEGFYLESKEDASRFNEHQMRKLRSTVGPT